MYGLHGVLLVFAKFHNWPSCRRSWRTNIELVGVSIDANPAEVEEFLKKQKQTDFKTWFDPTTSVEAVMPMEVVPTNFLLDAKGNLIGYLPGFLPWDDPTILPFLKELEKKYATVTK